jgi:hypothetical protein
MANVLVVDVANVMGSRPDGWWRDRAGAATRLLGELMGVIGQEVDGLDGGLDGGPIRVHRVIAVVEGQARAALVPDRAASAGLEVMAATADGDSSIVAAAQGVLAGEHLPIVVTADRGLRDRLPSGSVVAGPSWLLALL